MDDNDPLKPDPKRTAISINQLPEDEQAVISNKVLRQINFLALKGDINYKTNVDKPKNATIQETKGIEVLHSPRSESVPSSRDGRMESFYSTIADDSQSIYSTANSLQSEIIFTSESRPTDSADIIGIGRIKTKPDKSLPTRKKPGEVYKDCAMELQFLLGLYEIFIEQSISRKKPPRSMIPYKVRTAGELPHPSLNNTLRFAINSRHYNLMMGGEEIELGFSKITHLDSFLIKCYDLSGRNIFAALRPLTWITFFFGAVFFGNEIEVRNIEDKVIGRIRQVRDCNITLHIFDIYQDRIMCVRTNISVSRFGFVNLDHCVMKFYDWDDELLYATLVFNGSYCRKKFWNYERCVESTSKLQFDVEVHPIWKICILASFFFLFRNYLEERRPIFLGAGIILLLILLVIMLLIFCTITLVRESNSEI